MSKVELAFAGRGAAAGGCCCCGAHAHRTDGDGDKPGEGFSWTWRIVAPGILFAAGIIGGGWITGLMGVYPCYALMLGAYLLCGLPVLREAAGAIANRDFFNEFTLMGFASLAAVFLNEIPEAVGVMLFYSIGEAAQEKAAGKSRRSIQTLLASKPENANLLVDGGIAPSSPEMVAIGSSILVMPGEKVPLDGIVLSGSSSLDLSSLTGESVPARAGKGDRVYSGTICLDGDLTIETTAVYSDSMVGRILAMVENAAAAKSKTERFITSFARGYTPTVTGLAVLVAVVPPLFFEREWSAWIYRALVLLVVSCPCALLLSVPLAFFAGIGTASRHGMLVKGGQVFDALNRARAVIFDKTGTLTGGKPSLSGVEPVSGVDEKDLLRLAAAAELHSAHPVAKATVEAFHGASTLNREVTTRNIAGQGVVAVSAEGEILVGNARLMADRGIAVRENASSGLVSHVALDGRYLGRLVFSDRVKPDSVEAIRRLRDETGVRELYMLTGDRPEVADAVARETGLDGYRAGLLPDGKVRAFRELSPDGDAVFVGDGVNDAPVLAAAGVGVAMGALGSATAVEAADAVILDDSPARLPLLFRIAGKTRRIAAENILFALGVKTAIMLLGVAGLSGLWEAVFADAGVAFLSVLNSMRMTRV